VKNLKKILEILEEKYGVPDWAPKNIDPIGLVVSTILSQNTSDKNSSRAFSNLKKHFKNWYTVLEAEEKKIAKIIKSGGLPNIKAKRIKKSLLKIFEKRGELNIDFLGKEDVNTAMEWLQQLEGIGPKTAAVVLNFGFKKEIIPVDTHVHRVSQRIGFVGKTSASKTQIILNNEVPDELSYKFHVLLIQHGREMCKSLNPKCLLCPVRHYCDYFKSLKPK